MKQYMIPQGCRVTPYQKLANNTGNMYFQAPSDRTTIIDWYFNENDVEYVRKDADVNITLIKLETPGNYIAGFQVHTEWIIRIV